MTIRDAHCACGQLRIRAEGEPVRNSVCHCGQCKRRTGSAFAWNATYAVDQVAVEGTAITYEQTNESGNWARHRFCGRCGVFMYYEIQVRPGMISIPAGVFADREFPAPTVQVFDEIGCAWLPELPFEKT